MLLIPPDSPQIEDILLVDLYSNVFSSKPHGVLIPEPVEESHNRNGE